MDCRHGLLHQRVALFLKLFSHLLLRRVCSVSVLVVLWRRLGLAVEIRRSVRRKILEHRAGRARFSENVRDLFDAEVLLVRVDLLLGQVACDDCVEFLAGNLNEARLGASPARGA